MAKVKSKSVKELLDEQPKVSYIIPFHPNGELPVTAVTVNGYRYEIKHGERVEVPETVAKILDNSNSTLRQINSKYADMMVGSGRNLTDDMEADED